MISSINANKHTRGNTMKFKQDSPATIEQLLSTSDQSKIRLQIRQAIDRGGRSLDLIYQGNKDDERFNEPSDQVGWVTMSKTQATNMLPDLKGFIKKLEDNPDGQTMSGYGFVEVGIVNPTLSIEGNQAKLALRIVERTEPNEYDSDKPERAKRQGPEGEWLVDENGDLIFSYTQVGVVYPDLETAVFSGAGVQRKKVKLITKEGHLELPEDLHELIDFADTVADPAMVYTPSMPAGNIVEDVADEQEETAKVEA